ncbi:25-hydroxyvitamin D-1 alpha hydroxylase, mitochondrial [Collichthys lucidus]|uniref:25-hydroxyvitamin D-1 alpha hydroxylase, mitochondrial n=1 Tax=Collichthys lucidus TaxID=240159 RepID=A0A4U5UAU6_COLLU|nr:25-hydroxyvitamin D-1 alpha hydroxylase, mitochondrial [Collichthys lucidus]
MIYVRRMLQQALRVSGRSIFPLLKWMERWAEAASAAAAGQEGTKTALRTLDEMPGPSLEGVKRYGSMWKASFGPILTVHVADPALIEQVLRQEGQHPMRSDLSSWKDYRDLRGHHYGLLTSEGEEWQSVRSLLGKHMLRPKAVEAYDKALNNVVDDLIAKLRHSRHSQGLVTDIASEFYRFGLEAKGHIDQRLTTEAEKVARGEKVEGRYLTYFLSQTGLPMKTVYSNVTELLLAGVDTISATMSWSLYELSRHPEVQTSLREEVLSIMDGRSVPEAADVARMPLLKATVKEVLRLYPVIPANARVITERDVQVGGYLLPKNTLITLCQFATSRDPAVFPNPNEFQPHRWLNKDETHHAYASIPFGVGKRSCIGRRIAELELYLALARILMEFDVRPDPEGISVKPMTRTLLVPENVINLQFIER